MGYLKFLPIILVSYCMILLPVTNAKTQVTTTQNSQAKHLNITAENFRSNFNKQAQQIGAPQLKVFTYKNEGQNKSFKQSLPNGFALIGETDNKGNLKRISIGLDITLVPRSELGNYSMMLGGLGLTLAKAVDQNKVNEARDDVLQDTYESLWADKKTFTSYNIKNKTYKQYKYIAYSDPQLGVVMIGIEPSK